MDKLCDLHTHPYYSDGTVSPAELIGLARQAELGAVALCDHNTVAGLPEFAAAGENSGVEAVPGIEFSTDYGETELHIIMLFVKPRDHDTITALVSEARKRKEESTVALVRALQAGGFDICYEKLRAQAPDGYINRAHIGAELTKLGYTASIQEAFQNYLAPGKGFFVPPKRLDALETIGIIKELGGVAVLAHPFLNLTGEELVSFLPRGKAFGLDAMETRYSKFSPQTAAQAEELALRFGLLQSGGSDFHGDNKPDISIGTGRGELRVPMTFFAALQQAEKRQEIH